ncbi:uncharacterized protein [Macrobrachium rosenbergii]|uniref:uncharacterized protein n=1 Tax=Macrobrachium rosenbergii TaxID=79674 RepID=UPI0034D44437
MLIDNAMNIAPPYLYEEALAITRRMLEEASPTTTPDQWHEFHVKYYKHQVDLSLSSLGRDKLALQVTVGNETRPLITKRWWRTHSYSGFQISVEGGADFLFDCAAQSIIHNAPVSLASQPLLLGGILGSCFLLVIAGWVLYLIFRKPRRHDYDEAPPVPELPKSLLLSMDKVSHAPDASHHIYEEFDEDTLSRLRQKMNAATLGECLVAPKPSEQQPPPAAVGNEYDIPKGVPLRARPYERVKGAILPKERVYANEASLTLIEQKIKATTGIRDSMPETHYIEMHGIVNRGSVDMGTLGGQ